VVTVKAKPSSLKNGSGTVSVVISGTITDSGSGVDPTTAHYRVTDTEGTVQPSGSVTLSSKGTYSFAVQLDAIQIKKRSRLYKVYVSAADRVGNVGTGNLAIPVN
jgi:hypothetical protein